jgi:aminopeptidase-like protein
VNAPKKIDFISWAKVLFPINRSLTGKGNIETLKYIEKFSNKEFKIKYFKTNEKYFY